ncbi:MAG: hypothetical protein ACJA2S_001801 [Cyclobacteriaceae bacterium]|jgi:hypothetical protein
MVLFDSIFKKKVETAPFTPEQKKIVQSTFAQVIPISEQTAEIFCNKLF